MTGKKKIPPEVNGSLEKIRDLTNSTLQEVRRFSHELRPSVLEHFGIAEALELIVDEMSLREQTQVTIKVSGDEERLPEEIEIALFRVAQEALNNIRKHSAATRAQINLKYLKDRVRLNISDNGKGFDPDKIPERLTGSLGIIGMKERVQIIGGKLKIKSIPQVGTSVSVEVPRIKPHFS